MNSIVMNNTEYKIRNEKFYSKKESYKPWTENQVYHRNYQDQGHKGHNPT